MRLPYICPLLPAWPAPRARGHRYHPGRQAARDAGPWPLGRASGHRNAGDEWDWRLCCDGAHCRGRPGWARGDAPLLPGGGECAMTTVTTSRAAGVEQQAAARTEDAVKIYGKDQVEVRALDGVTVRFAASRYTAIMGPSGSGKSTLLHCAAGLDTLTSGAAYIGGTELGTLDDRRLTLLRRDRVGFVFQAFNLVPTLTVAENITLPLDLAG